MASKTSKQLFAALNAEEVANATPDRHNPAPDLAALSKVYGPRAALVYLEEMQHIDHMLDGEWPAWNATTPKARSFGHLPKDSRRLIKWLLKRRRLVAMGLGLNGVAIVEHGSKVVAIMVTNKRDAVKRNPGAFASCVSPPLLAVRTGEKLSLVERAVREVKPGYKGTWADWVSEWKAAQEPKPEPTPEPEPEPTPAPKKKKGAS